MRRPALGLIALVLGAALAARAQEPAAGVALLTMADGTTVALAEWSFSYEYQLWRAGTEAPFSAPLRRDSRELCVGKKAHSIAGASLEVLYRQPEGPGAGNDQAQGPVRVNGLTLVLAGKRTELKAEPPVRDLIVPQGAEKGLTYQALGLDLTGLTVTGTRRSLCLLTYAAIVECRPQPADRVVKVEFPR